MRLLLDTHAFLWWLAGDRRLSRRARTAIGRTDGTVYVSAASAWEISTKYRLGKLPGAAVVAEDIAGIIASQAFSPLSVSVVHAHRAGALPGEHRDPFDRMLIAQAQCEDLVIATNDEVFDHYGVNRVW